MKILMIGKGGVNIGSTRIWHHNLSQWLIKLGEDVQLNKSLGTDQYDLIIFSKNTDLKTLIEAKKQCPQAQIGIVNPSDYTHKAIEKMKCADFFIVGSIEEKVHYLNYKKRVCLIPLVEEIFMKQKQHSEKDEIVLGYHGNKHHLHQFFPHLTKAIERLSKQTKVKLKVMYNIKSLGKWSYGKPKGVEVIQKQWELDKIEEDLLECDIGLVPGCSELGPLQRRLCFLLDFLGAKSGFSNDYISRYKNTANAGRSFVFHQLKIPVIADLAPSNMHILGDDESGYLAQTEGSWYYALESLCHDYQLRQSMADRAFEKFNEYYEPSLWVKKMLNELSKKRA